MSKATLPAPHRFREDPTTPGVCRACPLIRRNAVHDEQAAAAVEAQAHQAQAEERRRLGEQED